MSDLIINKYEIDEIRVWWERSLWEQDWDFGMFEQLYAERMGWA